MKQFASLLRIMSFILLLSCYTSIVRAQAFTAEELKSQFIQDWERAKAYTFDYLNTMPADKYSLRPTDSIRTFAQQMLHLAMGNMGIGAIAVSNSNVPPGRNLEEAVSAQTKDSVTYFVMQSYDMIIEGIKNLDVSKFNEKRQFFGMDLPRYLWLMKVFEHQTHHRGQTTIYIRLAGVKPPQERLF